MSKKIVMTGGGSAGHVTPNLALVPGLLELGYEIHYVGTKGGIERSIIQQDPTTRHLPYHTIAAGKLRRYFSLKNVTDVFRVAMGCLQSAYILFRLKPDVVFAKGGFVSVPVLVGAWLNRIPAVGHESDITPGLANRLALPLVDKICYTFPESAEQLPRDKAIHTGTPIRLELFDGRADDGRQMCGFSSAKPVILVMGGSLGAKSINSIVRQVLPDLLERFQVCHICGRDNIDRSLIGTSGYRQFDYVGDGLADLFAMSDVVISRAGANALFELLALRKPNLLIPLSRTASRGDQILNAESFAKKGFSQVLSEEELTPESLLARLRATYDARHDMIRAMDNSSMRNGVLPIIEVIQSLVP